MNRKCRHCDRSIVDIKANGQVQWSECGSCRNYYPIKDGGGRRIRELVEYWERVRVPHNNGSS